MIGPDTITTRRDHCGLRNVRFAGRLGGLGAAIALAATAVVLLLLTTLVGLTALPGPAIGTEQSIFSALSSPAPWVMSVASVVSALVDRGVSVAVTVVLLGVLWWRTRRPELPLVAVVSLGGSAALMFAGKLLVDRPRPEDAAATAMFSAFPSGHAIRGMVFGLLLAWLLVRWRRSLWRYAVAAGVLVLAVGIGLSRVVLGVHWPTDVLGGWVLGAVWFAGIILILHPICSQPPDPAASPDPVR